MLTGCLLSTSGCFLLVVGAVAGATAATVVYVNGELDATYGYSYDKVVVATRKAINQLGYAKPMERIDQITATFTTHNAAGNIVTITVTKTSDTATKVAIRVGTMGDQLVSSQINDKIKSNL